MRFTLLNCQVQWERMMDDLGPGAADLEDALFNIESYILDIVEDEEEYILFLNGLLLMEHHYQALPIVTQVICVPSTNCLREIHDVFNDQGPTQNDEDH